MGRTAKLQKIEDEDRESKFGYVYAVSGPGKFNFLHVLQLQPFSFVKTVIFSLILANIIFIDIFNRS